MLGFDDPLVVGRDQSIGDTEIPMLPLGASAYVRAVALDAPAGDHLDAHDVACFQVWAIVVLPDVTIFPGMGVQKLRDWGAATRRTLDRNHAHWKREHRPALQLPDAPI